MRMLEGPGSAERLDRIQRRFRALQPGSAHRWLTWDRFWFAVACGLLFAASYTFASTSLDFGSPVLAARHYAAVGNCQTAAYVGLTPAHRGQPGYWATNDRDKDGIACELG
ncbi:MAG: excalibur calcium-binding domain-containing protein [Phenylobacterium sp.]|nr:excalibur calcium-binding domain-containing protein [Phenylobacterium sp.]